MYTRVQPCQLCVSVNCQCLTGLDQTQILTPDRRDQQQQQTMTQTPTTGSPLCQSSRPDRTYEPHRSNSASHHSRTGSQTGSRTSHSCGGRTSRTGNAVVTGSDESYPPGLRSPEQTSSPGSVLSNNAVDVGCCGTVGFGGSTLGRIGGDERDNGERTLMLTTGSNGNTLF